MSLLKVISLAAAGLISAAVVVLLFQNRRLFYSCPESTVQPFVANSSNDKSLIVYGWSSDELGKILSDFATLYETSKGLKYLMRSESDRLRVVFPEDIEPDLFSFLVNYVQYPKNFEPKGRSIASIGTTTLSLDFGLPSVDLNGRKAVFYIPNNDREHDLVYIRVDGQAYENSFAGRCWRAAKDPRMPPVVETLKQYE